MLEEYVLIEIKINYKYHILLKKEKLINIRVCLQTNQRRIAIRHVREKNVVADFS